MRPHTLLCLVTLAGTLTVLAPARAQQPDALRGLVRDVIYNELHDRERDSHWQYRSVCLSPSQNIVRDQIETDQGPIFRVIERGGSLLDSSQQRQEEKRLDTYVNNPSEIERVRHGHEEDEKRLASVMDLLPRAFLFANDGPSTGDIVRIAFRPDPAFVPSGYEARIVHALAGVLTIDQRQKRMIAMDGQIVERVDFGYGILGHVEKGGTFSIHRVQVSSEHWKTSLVDVHVEGKILLFKNVSKQQSESRSGFRAVPQRISLERAKEILDNDAAEGSLARLTLPAATR